MKIIGISGKMGVGKTTLAKLLAERLPGEVQRKGFGDFVKEEASAKYKFPLAWCYTQNGKRKEVAITYPGAEVVDHKIVREILQEYGDGKRAEYVDYWVDRLASHICFQQGYYAHVAFDLYFIIDDMRRRNEAWMVKSLGGKLVRLEPYEGWVEDPDFGQHGSETELDDFDGFDVVIKPVFGGLENEALSLINLLWV